MILCSGQYSHIQVNAKKRERTRQQAAEMKEMQKFLLIKVAFIVIFVHCFIDQS